MDQEQIADLLHQLADNVLIMARSIEQLQHRVKKLESEMTFETTDVVSKVYVPDLNTKYEG